MSIQDLDVGIAFSQEADRVAEDHYLVFGEAVDLAEDACSCGEASCFHLVAATISQARFHTNAS